LDIVEIPTVVVVVFVSRVGCGLLQPRPSLKQIEIKVAESSVSGTILYFAEIMHPHKIFFADLVIVSF
jgi:hypothetical protein